MKIAEKAIRAVGLQPVDDIQNFRRWWSVKLDAAALLVGAAAMSYGELPDDWRAALPHNMVAVLAGVGLVIKTASLFLRGAKQRRLCPPKERDDGHP